MPVNDTDIAFKKLLATVNERKSPQSLWNYHESHKNLCHPPFPWLLLIQFMLRLSHVKIKNSNMELGIY